MDPEKKEIENKENNEFINNEKLEADASKNLDEDKKKQLDRVINQKGFDEKKRIKAIKKIGIASKYSPEVLNDEEKFNRLLDEIIKETEVSDQRVEAYTDPDKKNIIKELYKNIDAGYSVSQKINLENIVIIDEILNTIISDKNYLLSFDDIINIVGNTVIDDAFCRFQERFFDLIYDKLSASGMDADKLVEQLYFPENSDILNTFIQMGYLISRIEGKNVELEKIINMPQDMIKKQFKIALDAASFKVSNIDSKAKKEEEERQRRLYARNAKRIEIAQKNIEAKNRNNKIYSSNIKQKENAPTIKNYKDATGAEIIAESNLDLSRIKTPENRGINEDMLKMPAFNLAWRRFISSEGESTININGNNVPLKRIISKNDFLNVYDIDNNTVDRNKLKSFLSKTYTNITDEELTSLEIKIQSFSSYFNSNIKDLSDKASNKVDEMDYRIKEAALGNVIDSIRGIFNKQTEQDGGKDSEGFEFTDNPPIIQEGNSLIIPCKINGTKTKIKYDMNSGKLFMNSPITKPEVATQGNNKFIIGNDNNFKEIKGTLNSINDILDEYYQPTQNAILNESSTQNSFQQARLGNGLAQQKENRKRFIEKRKKNKAAFKDALDQEIDVIGKSIKEEMGFQETKNSIIMKFLKTFNIINDTGKNNENVEILEGNDLYNIIQAIDNSKDDVGTLKKFEAITEQIITFAGLDRGKNKIDFKRSFNPEYGGLKGEIQIIMCNYIMNHPGIQTSISNDTFKNDLISLIYNNVISGDSNNKIIDIQKINKTGNNLEESENIQETASYEANNARK